MFLRKRRSLVGERESCTCDIPSTDQTGFMIRGPQQHANESDRLLVGDQYANHNPYSMTISLIWRKYHNLLANEIHEANPLKSGDEIYSHIKKRVVGRMQIITLHDWLPTYVLLDKKRFLQKRCSSSEFATLPLA